MWRAAARVAPLLTAARANSMAGDAQRHRQRTDRLKLAVLEVLRDRYDRGQLRLGLIGMPSPEKRLVPRQP
jgi:hypothetical protein